MQKMLISYTNFLLNQEPEKAEAEKQKLEEFTKEIARDLMVANEKIISRNKRIQYYQNQEYDNHKTISKLTDDKLDLLNVLEYYADEETYIPKMKKDAEGDLLENIKTTTPIATDLGYRAREILKQLSKNKKIEGGEEHEKS